MQKQTDHTMSPTGERMVPESAFSATFWEHVFRYRFATRFVRGKRVLDIASGEGYGLAALQAAGASEVVGVDISEEACQHARTKYGLDVRLGNAEDIPLDTASVDVIVSYETIEHVNDPARFLDECRRVLKPDGRLILSTPLRETYGTQNENEFHVSEMTEPETMDLLKRYFGRIDVWAQRPYTVPSWRAGAGPDDSAATRLRKVWTNFWSRVAVRAGQNRTLYDTSHWRDRPVEAINSTAGGNRPLNPYRILPRRRFGPLGPMYLIAICERPAVATPGR